MYDELRIMLINLELAEILSHPVSIYRGIVFLLVIWGPLTNDYRPLTPDWGLMTIDHGLGTNDYRLPDYLYTLSLIRREVT